MKKIAVYLRVSTAEQKDKGLSIESQKNVLYDYAKANEWIIFKEYKDEGISGKTIAKRKEFKQLLEDAKAGKFTTILITRFDRAFRNVKEALITLDELHKIGVDFVSIAEKIDTTTAMGKFFFVVISAFAELERSLSADRNKTIMKSKFMNGKMVGKGHFGYKVNKGNISLNKRKADIVKEIFKMLIEGKDYREITEKFKINPKMYYSIIRNPIYAGFISYDGKLKKGSFENLISLEDFKKINPDFKENEVI